MKYKGTIVEFDKMAVGEKKVIPDGDREQIVNAANRYNRPRERKDWIGVKVYEDKNGVTVVRSY